MLLWQGNLIVNVGDETNLHLPSHQELWVCPPSIMVRKRALKPKKTLGSIANDYLESFNKRLWYAIWINNMGHKSNAPILWNIWMRVNQKMHFCPWGFLSSSIINCFDKNTFIINFLLQYFFYWFLNWFEVLNPISLLILCRVIWDLAISFEIWLLW